MAIEIYKKGRKYCFICDKHKGIIIYSPEKMKDQVVWQDFGIENSKTLADELILEEYKKFRKNEK